MCNALVDLFLAYVPMMIQRLMLFFYYMKVNFAFFQIDVQGNMWGTDAWAVSSKMIDRICYSSIK